MNTPQVPGLSQNKSGLSRIEFMEFVMMLLRERFFGDNAVADQIQDDDIANFNMIKIAKVFVQKVLKPRFQPIDQFELKNWLNSSFEGTLVSKVMNVNQEMVIKVYAAILSKANEQKLSTKSAVAFLESENGLNMPRQEAVKCIALSKLPITDEKSLGYQNMQYFRVSLQEF